MTWTTRYAPKCRTADEAVAIVRSGNVVYYGGNAAIPMALVHALAARRSSLEGVTLCHVLLIGEDPLSGPGMEGHFRHNSLFVGSADRVAVNEGRADYVPVFLHQIPRLFEDGVVDLDVAMVMASPPDAHGYMSLGVETLASMAAVQNARHVIVQVNASMPRVHGDCFLHVDRADALVAHDAPLPTLPRRAPSDVELAIGSHIVPLVPAGATLQLGIGGVPDAVLASLHGDLDLGLHTEMLPDGAMEAMQRGVITCARKTLHPGKAVITFALGSEKLYAFLDDNPGIEARPVAYVNDPFVASQNDQLVAINAALEVDLTGQVCSDSIGARIYSGFGGQVDFIRAAARSRGGKPVIALSSTACNGTVSRIVPFLKQGAGVVTTRADVHWVVTEFGARNLFGLNLRERCEALIGLAHPDHRADLRTQARARGLVG